MKTKILITIDTEFSSHKDDMGIFGNISGKPYGLPLYINLAKKYDLKFTFFVDVYAVRKAFKSNFIDICKILLAEGHDLQLHTHPDGLFDEKRGQLCLYSFEEQLQIIKKGKELFEEWFSIVPIGHRAGDWAANIDTMRALQLNGIKIDSSMFSEYKYCRLNENNCPSVGGEMIEIPPSVYRINGLGVFNNSKLLSTDGNPLNEVMYVLQRMIKNHTPLINLVYHSFSFLKWDKKRTKYDFSINEIRKFEALLLFISKNKVLNPVLLKDLRLEDCFLEHGNKISTGLTYFFSRIADRLKA